MSPKLLIINNGLKDLRGHYFETGVSVVEAAAAAGLDPYLIGHVECCPSLLRAAPYIIPLCRTDHWMASDSAPSPDMRSIQPDPAAISRTPIETVLAGRVSLRDYLTARFETNVAPRSAPPRRSLRSFVPPLAPRVASVVFRWTKRLGRGLVPPALFPRAQSGWRRMKRLLGGGSAAAARPTPLDPLEARLLRAEFPTEFESMRRFQEDLTRAVGLTGTGPGDHVFFPTAHARELVAVRRLAEALGPDLSPTFHLEFRHALQADQTTWYDPIHNRIADGMCRYTMLHQVYFDWCRSLAPNPYVRVYTDTEELTEEYAWFSGLPFGTLPIPFRTERISERKRQPGEPLCLVCLGDVRDEKGFPWLPELVRALQSDAEAGRVRFVFQASLIDPVSNPGSASALAELRRMAAPYLRLPGLNGPLGPDEYFAIVSEADAILCPYSPQTYVRRSSGTLTEGIAAGIPTVVPAETWLARQQPAGTGTSFTDLASFVAATRELVAGYDRFAAQARAFRDGWRAVHNPASLVRALLTQHPPAVPVAA